MKKILLLAGLGVGLASLAGSCHAASSLKETCTNYGKTIFLEGVNIKSFDVTSISNTFNLETKDPDEWLSLEANLPSESGMFELAKAARFRGKAVDICYDPNGNYLLGIQWSDDE